MSKVAERVHGQIEKMTEGFHGVRGAIGGIATALGATSVGIIGLLVLATKQAKEFTHELSQAKFAGIDTERAKKFVLGLANAPTGTTIDLGQGMKDYTSLMGVLNDPRAVEAIMPTVRAMNQQYDKDVTTDIAKLFSAMGLTKPGQDKERKELLEQLSRASTINPALDMSTFSRNIQMMKDEGMAISPDELPFLIAMMAATARGGGASGSRMGMGTGLAGMAREMHNIGKEFTKHQITGKDIKPDDKLAEWMRLGVTAPMFTSAYSHPYSFIQKLAPKLLEAARVKPGEADTPEGRAAIIGELNKLGISGEASRFALQALLGGSGLAKLQGKAPGEAPLEAFNRRAAGAPGPMERSIEELEDEPLKKWENIWKRFTNVTEQVGEAAGKAGNKLADPLLKALAAISNSVDVHSDMVGRIATIVGGTAIVSTIVAITTAVVGILTPLGWMAIGIGAVGLAIVTFRDRIADFYHKSGMADFVAQQEAGIKARQLFFDKMYADLAKFFEGLPARVADKIAKLGADIGKMFGDAIDAIVNWARKHLPFGEAIFGKMGGPVPQQGLIGTPSGPSARPGGYVPGGGINQPFMPMSYHPESDVRPLVNAMRQAVSSQRQSEARPFVATLMIDGRKLAETVSTSLASLMEVPTQAPYHDSFAGWASPDQQFAST
jgi:hypothetical protein